MHCVRDAEISVCDCRGCRCFGCRCFDYLTHLADCCDLGSVYTAVFRPCEVRLAIAVGVVDVAAAVESRAAQTFL